MIVKDVMTTEFAACAPGDTLATVAKSMRNNDCGFIPVVSADGVLVGVVTDRDLALAVGGSTRAAERISAAEIMSAPVFACFADENLKVVLATMGTHHVRRLPVLDKQHGHVVGVLSLDDIARAPHRRGSPTPEQIVDALTRIVTTRALTPAV